LANFLGVKVCVFICKWNFCSGYCIANFKNYRREVITTPYSFVATTHWLHWNGITPVFADIEPEYCNLDPRKIEAAITSKNNCNSPGACLW